MNVRGAFLHDAEFDAYWAFKKNGVAVIDGMEPWLLEHCGERGIGWEQLRDLIGI